MAFGILLYNIETNSANLVVTAYNSFVIIRNLLFTRIKIRLNGYFIKRFGVWKRFRPNWKKIAELLNILPGVVRIGYKRVTGVKIYVRAAVGNITARSVHIIDLLINVPLFLETDNAVPVFIIKILRFSLKLIGERDGKRERFFLGKV